MCELLPASSHPRTIKLTMPLWMAGEFDEALSGLESLPKVIDSRLRGDISRLQKFMTI